MTTAPTPAAQPKVDRSTPAPPTQLPYETLLAKLQGKFPDVFSAPGEIGEVVTEIPAHQVREILTFLRDTPELKFDSLMSLAGYDDGKDIMVVYPMYSMIHRHRLLLKARVGREEPRIDTVCDIFRIANFMEREAYDLYGIEFVGHPDLRRIMNPEDWIGWPGRKDYEYPEQYNGVPTIRPGQYFADRIEKERALKDKALEEAAQRAAKETPPAAPAPKP
ncbi:MAG: NADH-quinone oxidoreductase subunit C [Planctomycetota bacterium]